MKKEAKLVFIGLLLIILLTTMVAYSWSDDFGPWGKQGKNRGGRHGVAEPVAITLIGLGLAGLGAYALKRRKKD